jgi:predicted nucleotidyltransferase component of viral defense system
LKQQAYFNYLEFPLFEVRSLDVIEMIAEKVRAAFQRAKVRDLYDLHRFATTPFDGELLRRLAVLKLWQVRDPFDPDALFARINGSNYDWQDLQRLMRANDRLEASEILRTVEARFGSLRNLSELERTLIGDARSGRNDRLAERLRAEIRALAGTVG